MAHAHVLDPLLSLLGLGGAPSSNCVGRSDTRRQDIFNLSWPHPVTFDFSSSDDWPTPSFKVTIPGGSAWTPVPTFHLSPARCIALDTTGGWSWLFFENIERGSGWARADPGYHMDQRARYFLLWGNDSKETASSVRVTPGDGDAQLYRTLCSVVLDAELYFRLCTTPFWIRLLFAALGRIPYYSGAARERLIGLALYVQLRVIFYKNDCWTDQGTVRIDWYWWEAPRWVWGFQAWSMVVISKATSRVLYWLGRVALGMREDYDEYNVIADSVDQSRVQGDKVARTEKVEA